MTDTELAAMIAAGLSLLAVLAPQPAFPVQTPPLTPAARTPSYA
jgi:hypothetical protein